jgi:hypothetical protein
MTDSITARWPRPATLLPVGRETRVRDDATAAALRAYLTVATDVPTKAVIRL